METVEIREWVMKRIVFALLSLALVSAPLLAQAPKDETREEKGLAIAQEADLRDQGFGDSAATMQMILRNRHGEESLRQMRTRTLEQTEDGDKGLIIFDEPRDVKGTALLTYTHKAGPDDQWLYLPALKRVKRIASNNKSGPFMGSEFAYEDLSSQEVEKYSYKFLRDEVFEGDGELAGKTVFVIERYPADEKSGYTRQTVWMDQDAYRVLKVEFYDRKDSLLKTLNLHEYQQYLDRYWRAGRMEMVNHQTGKSTTLTFTAYVFGNDFSDRDFDQNSLRAAR
jgi:outer membrane lipoprotein-sorting protein